MENKIEKSFWLKSLSESIGVDERVLYESLLPVETRRGVSLHQKDVSTTSTSVNKMEKSREEQLGEFFLALLIRFFDLMEYAIQSISVEYLKSDLNEAIYKSLILYYNDSNVNNTGAVNSFDLNDFSTWLKDKKAESEERQLKITVFDQLTEVNKLVLLGDNEYFELESDTAKAEIIRIIILLKRAFITGKMKHLESLIAKAEKNSDEKTVLELMGELKLLSDESRDLAK